MTHLVSHLHLTRMYTPQLSDVMFYKNQLICDFCESDMFHIFHVSWLFNSCI